jgi:hypothetical protein
VAGDFKKMTKQGMDSKVFWTNKKGAEIVRSTFVEEPITQNYKNLKMQTFKFQQSLCIQNAIYEN